MSHTHTLAEWAQFLSLGLIPVGALILLLAFAEANLAYFDPRRADESKRAVRVLLVVGPALHDVREYVADVRRHATAARNRARLTAAAALLTLALRLNSIPSAPQKGALR